MTTISIIIDIVFKIVVTIFIIYQFKINKDYFAITEVLWNSQEKLIESDLYIKKCIKRYDEVLKCKKKKNTN